MLTGIRYSRAFKMQAVREVESGRLCAWEVTQKYGVHGSATVMRWVRQLGSGKYGKIIRVEKPDEIKQLTRLRLDLRRAKEALADAHMELTLERAYLAEACEQMDVSVEGFKKKLSGRRRTGRSRLTGN
jgi:transposase-like protein